MNTEWIEPEKEWRQLCGEQGWHVETQAGLFENFLREKGLFREFVAFAREATADEEDGLKDVPDPIVKVRPVDGPVRTLLADLKLLSERFHGVEFGVPDEAHVIHHRPAVWAFVADGLLNEPQREKLGNALFGLNPPKLKPCPFCGQPLTVRWRKINPKASCATQDCWGGKLPVLQLDIPEFVAAWNTRSN